MPNLLISSQLCISCCLIPYLSLLLSWLVPNLLISSQSCIGCCLIFYLGLSLPWLVPNLLISSWSYIGSCLIPYLDLSLPWSVPNLLISSQSCIDWPDRTVGLGPDRTVLRSGPNFWDWTVPVLEKKTGPDCTLWLWKWESQFRVIWSLWALLLGVTPSRN